MRKWSPGWMAARSTYCTASSPPYAAAVAPMGDRARLVRQAPAPPVPPGIIAELGIGAEAEAGGAIHFVPDREPSACGPAWSINPEKTNPRIGRRGCPRPS